MVKSVLITGATGSIGSDLCRRLTDSFDVRSGVRHPVEGFPSPVVCELRDFDSVLGAVQGVDAVVHLAGQSWEADVHEYMIPDNVTGCYNLFEAARQAGVKRVIFASTYHVVKLYLEEGKRVDERVPVRPDTFYAVTKVFGEALARYYAEVHGLSVISARIGWFIPPDRLLSKSVLSEHFSQVRSLWISPRDMGQFITRCLTVEDIAYEVLNCTSGNAVSMLDLSRAREVLGYAPQDDAERLIQAAGQA